MFIFGIIVGFLVSFIIFGVSFFLLNIILKRYGSVITERVISQVANLAEKTILKSSIIYPENTKEIFEKEDSHLEDLLKN